MEVGVADSTAVEASLATLETEELASLKTDWASALTAPERKAAAEMAATIEVRIMSVMTDLYVWQNKGETVPAIERDKRYSALLPERRNLRAAWKKPKKSVVVGC